MKKYLSLLLLFTFIAFIGCLSASEEKTGESLEDKDNISLLPKDSAKEEFLFQNFSNFALKLRVLDEDEKPVNHAVVTVFDSTNRNSRAVSQVDGIIYQTFTDENGVAVLDMAINQDEDTLEVVIYKAGMKERVITIYEVRSNAEISGDVYTEEDLATITDPDSDGDGIPDKYDTLVHDATLVSHTHNRSYICAFEDQFPIPGDADFNDVVIQTLVSIYCSSSNPRNAVKVMVRSKVYAAGAGFNGMSVMLLLLGERYPVCENVKEKLKDSDGITHWNTGSEEEFYSGSTIDDLVVFFDPVDISLIKIPLDIYLFVPVAGNASPTKTADAEIHNPNVPSHPEYKEEYVDENGFPWAIIVCEDWKWPTEGTHIENAYEYFDDWYKLAQTGVLEKENEFADWYNYPGEDVYQNCPGFTPLPPLPYPANY